MLYNHTAVNMKYTYLPIALGAVACSAFHVEPTHRISSTVLSMNGEGVSRRVAIASTIGMSAFAGGALPAFAGSGAPTPEELERIRTGYKQIQYLLDNFEQETTVCRENGGECKRDAEPIRRVLGLRSTTDPLFQIEKVFAKVKNMDIGKLHLICQRARVALRLTLFRRTNRSRQARGFLRSL